MLGVVGLFALGFTVLHLAAPKTPLERLESEPTDPGASPNEAGDAVRGRGLIGVIIADESVDVAARVDGVITSVSVRLGDRVSERDEIASIDDRALRNELAVMRASLNAAFADRDRVNLELAEAAEQHERWRALSEKHSAVVSDEELRGLVYKRRYAEQRLKTAEAKVAEYGARLQELERQIAESTVRAPFDGMVAQRYVDSGAAVTPGKPIVRLVREGEFWVRFAVPEDTNHLLRLGGRVTVRLDTLESSLTATVAKISPEIDAASRMIFVEARLTIPPELSDLPLAGRVVRVHLDEGEAQPAPARP